MNNDELIEYAIRTSKAIKEEVKPELIDYFYKKQERIEYLERSNNRREDIILEQRQKISDLEDDKNKLKTINEEYERLNKENGKGFTITGIQQYNMYELLSFKNYKDNWNKLKEYIKTEIPEDVFIDTEWFVSILDKMQELEKRSDSDE